MRIPLTTPIALDQSGSIRVHLGMDGCSEDGEMGLVLTDPAMAAFEVGEALSDIGIRQTEHQSPSLR